MHRDIPLFSDSRGKRGSGVSGMTYALIGICVLLFVGYINLHFGKSAAVREAERHRRDIVAHTAKVQHLEAQHTLKDRSREEMQASIDSLNKRLETAEAALQREAVKAKEFEEKVAVMEGTIELHKQEVEKCGKEKKAAEDESRHAKIEAEYANDALKRCKTDLATSVDGVSSAGLNAGRDPRTAAPEHKKSGATRVEHKKSGASHAEVEVEDEPEDVIEDAPLPRETRRGGDGDGDAGVIFADDETAKAFGFRSGRD